MNKLKILENSEFGRVRTAISQSNEPLFCLADVCKCLGISNNRNVSARLEEDDVRQMDATDSIGRTQQTTFVTEAGLYDVIVRSDSPKAKPFRRWICKEVLPTLRKDGMYIVGEEKAQSEEEIILLAHKLLEKKVERLQAENQVLQQQVENEKPKVMGYNNMMATDGLYSVEQAAKWYSSKGYRIGRNQLFKLMRDIQLLRHNNLPYQMYIDKEYFDVKMVSVGYGLVRSQTFLTNKGLDYVWNKIKDLPVPEINAQKTQGVNARQVSAWSGSKVLSTPQNGIGIA